MNTITNSLSSVQKRTPTKRTKVKKNNKPIKVVYISNPMKVKTSASEFRALVQELTGQDAESPPDPSRYGGGGDGDGDADGGHHMVDNCDEDYCLKKKIGDDGGENDETLVMPPPSEGDHNTNEGQKLDGVSISSSMEDFEPFDDIFTSQMIENISAFLPESVFNECAQVDHQMLMQCNFIQQ